MKGIFTISTPNYIGYSISLFNSLLKYNNEVSFYLIVFRPNNEIKKSLIPEGMTVIYLDELQLDELAEDFLKSYPVNKVCFALKPIVANKLLNKYKDLKKLAYFDSDILIYNTLDFIWDDLESSNIVLTPHIIEPLKDDKERIELRMLSRNGVFNAGFFAIKKAHETTLFLEWWFDRLTNFGLFGDQLWLNFSPTLFNIKISRNFGYNVAFYNLPNRKIKKIDNSDKYMVNDRDELVFFHFVQYNMFSDPDKISLARLKQKQLTFAKRPELIPIFKDYRESLLSADVKRFYGYKFVGNKKSWLNKKIIYFKNQTIRALYKIIFEIVDVNKNSIK